MCSYKLYSGGSLYIVPAVWIISKYIHSAVPEYEFYAALYFQHLTVKSFFLFFYVSTYLTPSYI